MGLGSRVDLDNHKNIGKLCFQIFYQLKFCNNQFSIHRIGNAYAVHPILFAFGLGVGEWGQSYQTSFGMGVGEWGQSYQTSFCTTVKPRYNVVVWVHDFGLHCTRGALGVPISTRELLNNSVRIPLWNRFVTMTMYWTNKPTNRR